MTDVNPTTPYTIVVVGARGRIGREVARLAVAYGANVIGVGRTAVPPNDEPWVHGVSWVALDAADDPDALGELGGTHLVVAASVEIPEAIADRFERVVVVREPTSVSSVTGDLVVATPRAIDDSSLDDPAAALQAMEQGAIRVEMLGMALLRAAIDEAVTSQILDQEDLRDLGDAVMLQRAPSTR